MTMKAQRKNYVLVYADDHDPAPEETAELLATLRPLSAEEVLPGTVRVTATRREVEACLGGMAHWQLSSEKVLTLNPPKAQFRR